MCKHSLGVWYNSIVSTSYKADLDLPRLTAELNWSSAETTATTSFPSNSSTATRAITDDFDVDFGVDEWHGTIAFIREGDRVFRTYFVDGRGDEAFVTTWNYLDITALGRQEDWEDAPDHVAQTPPYTWWKWHDAYDAPPAPEHLEQIARAPDAARREPGA